MCTPMIAPAEAVAPGASCNLTDPFKRPMKNVVLRPRFLKPLVGISMRAAVVVLFGVCPLTGGDVLGPLTRPCRSPPGIGLSARFSRITLERSVKVGWTTPR